MTPNLYKTATWRRTRIRILTRDLWACQWPGCGVLLVSGRKDPRSAVVDHKTPHNGDRALFFDDENLWSLCKHHHDGLKKSEERLGYSDVIGPDGYPISQDHPFFAGPRKVWGYSIPHGLKPSGVPVTLVCGPPASGKSTYVADHAAPGDVVIDFDLIRKKVGGTKWDQDMSVRRRAFAYRDRILRTLKDRRSGHCWLIVTAPSCKERDAWCAALGNTIVVVMDTPENVCIERIDADPERHASANGMKRAVREWFKAQRPRGDGGVNRSIARALGIVVGRKTFT